MPASSGSLVRVNLPSESVISDGSLTMTPLLSIRRTKISKRLIGRLLLLGSVSTPCTRRGLDAPGSASTPR
jgi:hypothetical protein